jgi:hypothetical protein
MDEDRIARGSSMPEHHYPLPTAPHQPYQPAQSAP